MRRRGGFPMANEEAKKVERELEDPADFTTPEELYKDLVRTIRRLRKRTESRTRPMKDRNENRVNRTSFTRFVLRLFLLT